MHVKKQTKTKTHTPRLIQAAAAPVGESTVNLKPPLTAPLFTKPAMNAVQSTPHTSLRSAPLSDPKPTQEPRSKVKQTLCSLPSEACSISKRGSEREKSGNLQGICVRLCSWKRVGQTCVGQAGMCLWVCVRDLKLCSIHSIYVFVYWCSGWIYMLAGEQRNERLCVCSSVYVWRHLYMYCTILNMCVFRAMFQGSAWGVHLRKCVLHPLSRLWWILCLCGCMSVCLNLSRELSGYVPLLLAGRGSSSINIHPPDIKRDSKTRARVSV